MGNLCCIPRRPKKGQKSLPRTRDVNSKTLLIDTVSIGSSRDGDRAEVTEERKANFSDVFPPTITKATDLVKHSVKDQDHVAIMKEEIIGNFANEIEDASLDVQSDFSGHKSDFSKHKSDLSEFTEETYSSLIHFYQEEDQNDTMKEDHAKSKPELNIKESKSLHSILSQNSEPTKLQLKHQMISENEKEGSTPDTCIIETLSTMTQNEIKIIIELPTSNKCTNTSEMELKREPSTNYAIARKVTTEVTQPQSVGFKGARTEKAIKDISDLGRMLPYSAAPIGANGEETERRKATAMVVRMEKYCVTIEYPELRLGSFRNFANMQNLMLRQDRPSFKGKDKSLFKVMCDRVKKMLDQIIVYANTKQDKWTPPMVTEALSSQKNGTGTYSCARHIVETTGRGLSLNKPVDENPKFDSKPGLLIIGFTPKPSEPAPTMIEDPSNDSKSGLLMVEDELKCCTLSDKSVSNHEPDQQKVAHPFKDIDIETPKYVRLENTPQKLNSYRVANLQTLMFWQMSPPQRGRNRKLFEVVCCRVKKRIQNIEEDAHKRLAKWAPNTFVFSHPSIPISSNTVGKGEETSTGDIGQDQHTAHDKGDSRNEDQPKAKDSTTNNLTRSSCEEGDSTNHLELGPHLDMYSLGSFMSGPYEKVVKLNMAEELFITCIDVDRNTDKNGHISVEFALENKDLPSEIDRGPLEKTAAPNKDERATVENKHNTNDKERCVDLGADVIDQRPSSQETTRKRPKDFEHEPSEIERSLNGDVPHDGSAENRVYGKTHRKRENFVENLRNCVNTIREANSLQKLHNDYGFSEGSTTPERCKELATITEETGETKSTGLIRSDIQVTKQMNENGSECDNIKSNKIIYRKVICGINEIQFESNYKDPLDRDHDPVIEIGSDLGDEVVVGDTVGLVEDYNVPKLIPLTVNNVNRVYRNENSNSAINGIDRGANEVNDNVIDTNAENEDGESEYSSLATDPCGSDRHMSDFELSSDSDSDSEEDEIMEYVNRPFPHSAKFPNRKVELNFLTCFNIKPLPLQVRKCYKELLADDDDGEVKQMTDEDARGSILEIRAERDRRREEMERSYERAQLGKRVRLQELKDRRASTSSPKYVDAGT